MVRSHCSWPAWVPGPLLAACSPAHTVFPAALSDGYQPSHSIILKWGCCPVSTSGQLCARHMYLSRFGTKSGCTMWKSTQTSTPLQLPTESKPFYSHPHEVCFDPHGTLHACSCQHSPTIAYLDDSCACFSTAWWRLSSASTASAERPDWSRSNGLRGTLHVSLIIGCERLNLALLALRNSQVTPNQSIEAVKSPPPGPQHVLGPAQRRFGRVDTR